LPVEFQEAGGVSLLKRALAKNPEGRFRSASKFKASIEELSGSVERSSRRRSEKVEAKKVEAKKVEAKKREAKKREAKKREAKKREAKKREAKKREAKKREDVPPETKGKRSDYKWKVIGVIYELWPFLILLWPFLILGVVVILISKSCVMTEDNSSSIELSTEDMEHFLVAESERSAHKEWHCMCYKEIYQGSPRMSTACRQAVKNCWKLYRKVERGSSVLVAGSQSEGCSIMKGKHPADGSNQDKNLWLESKVPGSWWSPHGCYLKGNKILFPASPRTHEIR
jgi:hypothetical protein